MCVCDYACMYVCVYVCLCMRKRRDIDVEYYQNCSNEQIYSSNVFSYTTLS